eukprot:UN13286
MKLVQVRENLISLGFTSNPGPRPPLDPSLHYVQFQRVLIQSVIWQYSIDYGNLRVSLYMAYSFSTDTVKPAPENSSPPLSYHIMISTGYLCSTNSPR